jgi:hypothetical protein
MATYAMPAVDDITWTAEISPNDKDTALPGILVAVGGEVSELKAEVIFIMNEASSRRNVTSILKAVHLGVGPYAIVSKVCFNDGICWAVKMYENRPSSIFDRAIDYGTSAANLVQQYCPDIPINTPRGCGVHKLRYCFTDWIEGETLFDRYFPITRQLQPSEQVTITIPQKTISSLAEFVYNLTTCPIPEIESKLFFSPELMVVMMMKRDDMKYYLRAPKGFNIPEARNMTEWIKHQFWMWYLLSPRSSIKPYDGLDYLLLMRWVSEWFSGLEELPFVLHYWDLRMPNIIVDEKDNLKAYNPIY